MVRVRTGAHTVVMAIFGGDKGDGFSVQTMDPDVRKNLPIVLREMANQIAEEN